MHFVYRSHYEGPLSRRIRPVPDNTVLAWFQRGWNCDDPRSWVKSELGGHVYGLSSIFTKAASRDLPVPGTTDELRELLHRHLYVEGDESYIQLDDHSLRVRTNDDEVELAYFFFDDEVLAAAPDRLAYVVRDDWLPEEVETTVTSRSPEPATTHAVFLTFYDSGSFDDLRPVAFPGVELADLGAHLAATVPDAEDRPELMVLRALVAPGEADVAAALERCNDWPGFNLSDDPWPDLPTDHAAAHKAAIALLADAEYTRGRRPEASVLRTSDHLIQLAMHCNEAFGYQQWYLFDTAWASTHPDLAQSLLRYGFDWDPLGP